MAWASLPLLEPLERIHSDTIDPHFPVQMRPCDASGRTSLSENLTNIDDLPELKVVLEHITTAEAADFVAGGPANLAATVTPQHLIINRNAIFAGGLRPHAYCLPVAKREQHRLAVSRQQYVRRLYVQVYQTSLMHVFQGVR